MLNLLGSVGSFFASVGYILLAIVVLMIMIVIHELGHYTAGKLFKFKINEFSIGFGKALFSRKLKSGEVFSIRLVPLGGYCAFEGEDSDGNTENDFNSQAWWKRLIVLFSGAFFNFLSAIIFSVFLLAFASSGYSKVKYTENVVYQSAQHLEVGDVILEVNGTKTRFLNGGFAGLLEEAPDKNITLTVERVIDGKKQKIDIVVDKHQSQDENGKLEYNKNGSPVMIVGVETDHHTYSFGKALYMSVPVTFEMAWDCLIIFGKLIIGQYDLSNLTGPIGTISTIATASRHLINLLLLFPVISVNLAVFNWLPIPALDGARMVFVLIEAIRKKPIKRELEAKIHNIGLFILFGLVIIVDILHLLIFRG